jgi:hypothetical protein
MKCIECQQRIKNRKKLALNKHLSHINNWGVCDCCADKDIKRNKAKSSLYYKQNKQRYRQLHISYKSNLIDSYVANALADRTELKATDIPQSLIKAKRQFMKINRVVKK